MGRAPIRWAVAVILSAGLGSACDGDSAEAPFAVDVSDSGPTSWATTGMPYGGLSADRATWELGYRGHTVRIPTTHPAWTEAADLGPGAEVPRVELSTAGATADAAVFQLRPPGELAELWELTVDGEWRSIGSQVSKLALTDVDGHLVAWVQGSGDTGRIRDGTAVVAYDTARGEVVGRLPAERLPGERVFLVAVDDDAVVFEVLEPSGTYQADVATYLWRPGADGDALRELDLPDGHEVTAYHRSGLVALASRAAQASLLGPAEERPRRLPVGGFGQFSGDGSLVGVSEGSWVAVFDTRTLDRLEFDVPITSPSRFVDARLTWTPDGRLVVEGALDDGALNAWLCTPATGECEDQGRDFLGAIFSNSSLGEAAYHASSA